MEIVWGSAERLGVSCPPSPPPSPRSPPPLLGEIPHGMRRHEHKTASTVAFRAMLEKGQSVTILYGVGAERGEGPTSPRSAIKVSLGRLPQNKTVPRSAPSRPLYMPPIPCPVDHAYVDSSGKDGLRAEKRGWLLLGEPSACIHVRDLTPDILKSCSKVTLLSDVVSFRLPHF